MNMVFHNKKVLLTRNTRDVLKKYGLPRRLCVDKNSIKNDKGNHNNNNNNNNHNNNSYHLRWLVTTLAKPQNEGVLSRSWHRHAQQQFQKERPHRRFVSSSSSSSSSSSTTLEKKRQEDQEALEFLAQRGRSLGIRLSLAERQMIAQEIKANDGGSYTTTLQRWEELVSRRALAQDELMTLSAYLQKSHDGYIGQNILLQTSRLGSSFFALTGAYIAGSEGGMHVLGAVMVGCISGLGGGTINSIVTAKPVGWLRDPTTLILAMGASLLGFFVWPLLEVISSQEEQDSTTVTTTTNTNTAAATSGDAIARSSSSSSSSNYTDGLQPKQQQSPPSSSLLRYGFESIALASLAVVGAQQGIVAGCHPLVSSILGVSIAFGGVVRDLMCHRDLALGAQTGCQSYGLASFLGAAMYVALRELHVWNCRGSTSQLLLGGIPIGFRIFCGFSTAMAVRALAWEYKAQDNFLLSMQDSAHLHYHWIVDHLHHSLLHNKGNSPTSRDEEPQPYKEDTKK